MKIGNSNSVPRVHASYRTISGSDCSSEADARLRAAEERIQVAEVVIDPEALTNALAELEAAKAEHHTVYERWVELTEKISG